MEDSKLLKGLFSLLNKHFNEVDSTQPTPTESLEVSKAYDEELRQATFLVLAPDEVDLHGDVYDSDEVRKACHNFQVHCRKANLFHVAETDTASIVESYITPSDFILGETEIKKGSWLQVWQIHDEGIWELVKSGEINGVSVGCSANYEEL